MAIPPLTVRPIVHTDHVDAWATILRCLGARTLTDDPMWTELELDSGRVTLSVLNRDAVEGEVVLGFETPDLEKYAAAVSPADGLAVTPFATDDYRSLRVVGRDGLEFLLDPELADETASPPQAPGLPRGRVRAVWRTPDSEATRVDLLRLGLEEIPGDGNDVRLAAADGEVVVRAASSPPTVDVEIVADDVTAAREALVAAGIAGVVEQAPALHVPVPGTDGHLVVRP